MPKTPPKNIYERNGILWARFKVKGKLYRESLHTRSEPVARKRLKVLREQIENAIYYGEQPPVSWEAAVVQWAAAIPRLGLKPDTAKRYAVSIKQMEDWLVGMDVQKINGETIKRIIRDRSRRGTSNATIRRDLTAISSVLAVAVDEGWIEDNPAKLIDRSRVKEKRDPIYLPEAASIDAMLALGSRFMDLADFARETGMRENEIVTLRHAQVDRSRMAVMLTETKTGRARSVPLTARAIEIIDRQPAYIRSPFVFWRGDGQAFKNVSSQFYATGKRVARKVTQAGGTFRRFRFHDLRHLFAVAYLRDRRGTIYDLQQILGHASIKTTELYLDYLTPDERKDAMQGVTQSETQNQRSADQGAA